MKALEFKTKIKNNQIQIPIGMRAEFKTNPDKQVRVIVLIDDSEINDDSIVQESASEHFLKGYADTDSIYDNI